MEARLEIQEPTIADESGKTERHQRHPVFGGAEEGLVDKPRAEADAVDEIDREDSNRAARAREKRMDWEAIAARAAQDFPEDYRGRVEVSPGLPFASRRMDWLAYWLH